MTRWRLIKALLAVSAVAIVGLGVAAGVSASRGSSSDQDTSGHIHDNSAEPTAWLGILGDNSEDPAGVRIVHVFEDTAATDAGLEPDDVITAIDGDEVADIDGLRDTIGTHSPGDEVTLTVIKGGEGDASDVDVILGEQIDQGFFDQLHDRGHVHLGGTIFDIINGLDSFLDGAFRYRDNNGDIHEVSAVAGTLIEISDDSITILTDATGERTFELTTDTYVPDGLEPDDDVIVFSLDGDVEAVFAPGRLFDSIDIPNFHFDFEDIPFCDEEPSDHPDVEKMRDAICDGRFDMGPLSPDECRVEVGPSATTPSPHQWELLDTCSALPGIHFDPMQIFCDGGQLPFPRLLGLFDEERIREDYCD